MAMNFGSNGLACLNAGDEVPLKQQWLASDTAQQAGDRCFDLSAEPPIEAIEDVPDELPRL